MIFSIINPKSYKKYNIPSPFGYLVTKNSEGKWIPSGQPLVFIDNSQDTALQVDEVLNRNDFKEFVANMERDSAHYAWQAESFIPCLFNERIMLIAKNFLQPVF